MKKIAVFFLFIFFSTAGYSQTSTTKNNSSNQIARPKLVVGIVVDQMRWDYLYRYYSLFKINGGFKKLLNEGFTCENTFIPYTPTVTAAGHTCVYTGSVPAIHGIVGNDWWDYEKNKTVYCTDDSTIISVGSNDNAGKMSPRNMLTTTVGDELRLATNFKSKVIGISLKDRAAILPAGHSANAAFWYNYKTGNFITSSYYMNELPAWIKNFNNRKMVDSFYQLNWNLSFPKNIYTDYSTADEEPYEKKPFGKDQTSFPYNLSKFIAKDYSMIASTPYGNSLLVALAETAITNENLGKNNATDFLAVSFSSPDYIGHAFGPNSWEMMDDYVKLDDELGKFFSFLDANIGKGNYTFFLTADHGVAHIPLFDKEHNLPGGSFDDAALVKNMNNLIKQKSGIDSLIVGIYNYQVVYDRKLMNEKNIGEDKLTPWVVDYLMKQDAVSAAFDIRLLNMRPMNAKQREMMMNGYYLGRSGSVQIILKPGYVEGNGSGTSHGLWNPYDSHIPLLFYGWGIKHGSSNHEVYMTDIAPTISALLHIQMPSGCVGKVIEEVLK
ncbi:MAG: alkaline phosphatase PafA [Chitinophagaceae bacterium]